MSSKAHLMFDNGKYKKYDNIEIEKLDQTQIDSLLIKLGEPKRLTVHHNSIETKSSIPTTYGDEKTLTECWNKLKEDCFIEFDSEKGNIRI